MFARYTPFIRNAFLAMLAYRLRYYTGILTYFIFFSVHYFIWQAVFDGQEPGAKINGFTLPEMVTYIAVGWVSRSMYFSDIDETIDEWVRSGQISMHLLRPVNFQLMLLSEAFGGSLFRASCFTLPLSIVIFLCFPVAPPAGIAAGFLFFAGTLLAFAVLAEVNFLVGILSFYLKSIQGILRAKYYLLQLLSGLLLPLTFFPATVKEILEYLPFQAITFVPLQLYLGKVQGGAALLVLGQQLLWVVVLFFLGAFFWKRAVAKLTLHGG